MRQAGSLTEGSVYRSILSFALLQLGSLALQACYGVTDLMVIGWFSGSAGIAAVSIGTTVTQLFSAMISGLGLGTTILIGQCVGAGNDEDTNQAIGTSFSLFGVASLALAAIMLLFAPQLLKMLNTPSVSFSDALSYLRIMACGIPFTYGFAAISAVLRGFGDAKRPLAFAVVSCGVNILLDLLLIGGLGLGASGAAFATILAQGLSVFLSVVHLKKSRFLFRFERSSFLIHPAKAAALLRLGLPVTVQETLMSLASAFVSTIINACGVTAAAAAGISAKSLHFAQMPSAACWSAIAAISAQCIGAGMPERAKRAHTACLTITFPCAVVLTALILAFPEVVFTLFRADALTTAAGIPYLRGYGLLLLAVSLSYCNNGFINGCGKTMVCALNSVLGSVLIRVPLALLFSKIAPGNLMLLGLAAPISNFATVVVTALYIRSGRWRLTNVSM